MKRGKYKIEYTPIHSNKKNHLVNRRSVLNRSELLARDVITSSFDSNLLRIDWIHMNLTAADIVFSQITALHLIYCVFNLEP